MVLTRLSEQSDEGASSCKEVVVNKGLMEAVFFWGEGGGLLEGGLKCQLSEPRTPINVKCRPQSRPMGNCLAKFRSFDVSKPQRVLPRQ